MSNLSVENVYTRHTAKDLAKRHFWKLVAMMAIVYGVTYGISMGGSTLLTLTKDATIISAGSFLLTIITTFVGGALSMGMLAATLDLCRGNETISVGRVFCRMNQCLKIFGLTLWVGLKMILWALPAYAAVVVVIVPLSSGSLDSEVTKLLMTLLPVVVMFLVFALVVPAALRYMLSAFILADKPETGVFECVRQSKAMMKGHKWQAFKLVVPLILVMYVFMMLITLGFSFLIGTLAQTVAASIASTVCFIAIICLIIYFSVRMMLAYTLFYLKRTGEQETITATVEA